MMDVRLRKIRGSEIETLVRARIEEAGTLAQPGPAPQADRIRTQLQDRVAHSGGFFNGEILLGIEVDGRLVGEIQARRPENAMPPGVFELGIGLFEPSERGKGIGSHAVALMTARLMDEEGAHRVQAGTDLENVAMRTVLERLGFGLEGVMRGFMPSPKGPRDYALYGITKVMYEEMKPTWTRIG
jgi:RimJ/RimL family protein N-acetyltransferase